MKTRKKVYSTLLATCMALSISGTALAEDMSIADPSDVVVGYDEPAQIDREAMIEELIVQWGSDDTTAYQLRAMLENANDSKLLAAWNADSLDEINAILLGGTVLDGILTLNDTDEDYTFTPVTPCRIVDTRNAGGIMTAGSTREFYVYGPGTDMTPQGGNAAGCASPVGEPLGVMINVTAVPSGNGNLRAYPANVATPNASLVNYKSGVNIANAAAVKTYYSGGPKELEIYSSANSHVIIDVMGYYDMPQDTRPDQYITNTQTSVAAGAQFNIFSPACPSSYRLSGGGWAGQLYSDNAPIGARPANGTSYSFVSGANIADRYLCQGINTAGSSRTYTCFSVCNRIPGR